MKILEKQKPNVKIEIEKTMSNNSEKPANPSKLLERELEEISGGEQQIQKTKIKDGQNDAEGKGNIEDESPNVDNYFENAANREGCNSGRKQSQSLSDYEQEKNEEQKKE